MVVTLVVVGSHSYLTATKFYQSNFTLPFKSLQTFFLCANTYKKKSLHYYNFIFSGCRYYCFNGIKNNALENLNTCEFYNF